MKLISRIIIGALSRNAKAFEKCTKQPIVTQEKLLLRYLARNKDTEYGRKFGFSRIRSVKEYQNAVRVTNSKLLVPYFDRIESGQQNILTSDKVIFFGSTSGTTGRPKLIPVTKYSTKIKNEHMLLWTYYVYRDHPDVLDGKILAIISPELEGYTSAGIPYGAESGFAYRRLPRVVKHLYVLPYEVFEIPDYEARYYSILRFSMSHNITNIATLNPSTIVLLCQKISKWQDKIIRDIELGGIDKGFDIPEQIRKTLKRRLRPDVKRANELRSILKKKGRLLPKDFWPNLKLIECWKGGTVKLYLKEMPEYFGGAPIRDLGCLSTEARSSITMGDEGADGVLAVNINFYEFVPVEDIAKEKKRYLLCNQIKPGQNYYLVVTTAGGLYRYDIDDIITVKGYFNKTPVIQFVQKGINAVSITGEKLYEAHINEAVNAALQAHKLFLNFFCAQAVINGKPRYIFLVEFNNRPTTGEKKLFLRAVENELYKQNEEYRSIRKQGLLASPVMKIIKTGDFEKYRAKRVSEGVHDGQFKAPQLVLNSEFEKNFSIIEEISYDSKD